MSSGGCQIISAGLQMDISPADLPTVSKHCVILKSGETLVLTLNESSLEAHLVYSFSEEAAMKVLAVLVLAGQHWVGCGESRAVTQKAASGTLWDRVTSVCVHLHSQPQENQWALLNKLPWVNSCRNLHVRYTAVRMQTFRLALYKG